MQEHGVESTLCIAYWCVNSDQLLAVLKEREAATSSLIELRFVLLLALFSSRHLNKQQQLPARKETLSYTRALNKTIRPATQVHVLKNEVCTHYCSALRCFFYAS